METLSLLARFYLPGTLRWATRILMGMSLGTKCPVGRPWAASSKSPESYPVGITQVRPGVPSTALGIASRKDVSDGGLRVQASA